MLILSRTADESVKVGDEITITILSVKGKQVRIGFSAPDDVRIHREEIYERIQAEKIDSTDTSDMDNVVAD